jgi:hypothetical protein
MTSGSFSATTFMFALANLSKNQNSLLIRNVGVGMVGFVGGAGNPSEYSDLYMAITRSLTAPATGGTLAKFAGTLNGRKRSNLVGGVTNIDCRGYTVSSGLGNVTGTTDSNYFRVLNGSGFNNGVMNASFLGVVSTPNNMFDCKNGGYPLVLAPGEGFVIGIINASSIYGDVKYSFVVDLMEVVTPWS